MEGKKTASSSSENEKRSRQDTAKATVNDQISQAIQSTCNLLHLMQHTSSAQAQLSKLPKNLLAKSSMIKNTGQVLEEMPRVISSLDAHMENGLQSVHHLRIVIQLLETMEGCQFNALSHAGLPEKEPESLNQPPKAS